MLPSAVGLRSFSNGEVYLNFPGSRAEKKEAVDELEESYLRRLHSVQKACDPEGLFG